MIKIIYLTILTLAFSCKSEKADSEILINIDKQFSALSATKGTNIAFIEYAHDSAVLLRSNSYPIVGKQYLKNLFNGNDSTYTLTWEPRFGFISESNDLGYTYGIYKVKTADTIKYGTYVSVWKNTEKGWKYVLDSGNEGLGK